MRTDENSLLTLSGMKTTVGLASTLVGVIPGVFTLFGILPFPSAYRPMFGLVLSAIGITVLLLGYSSIIRLRKHKSQMHSIDQGEQYQSRDKKRQRRVVGAVIFCLIIGIASMVTLSELLRQSVIMDSDRGSGEFVFPLPALAEGPLRDLLDDGNDYQTILNDKLGARGVDLAIADQSEWARSGTTLILVIILGLSALSFNTSFVLLWRLLAQAELAANRDNSSSASDPNK